jgi:hypothetical protein
MAERRRRTRRKDAGWRRYSERLQLDPSVCKTAIEIKAPARGPHIIRRISAGRQLATQPKIMIPSASS